MRRISTRTLKITLEHRYKSVRKLHALNRFLLREKLNSILEIRYFHYHWTKLRTGRSWKIHRASVYLRRAKRNERVANAFTSQHEFIRARTRESKIYSDDFRRDDQARCTKTPNEGRRCWGVSIGICFSLHQCWWNINVDEIERNTAQASQEITRDPFLSGKTRTGEARDEPTPSHPVSWSLSTLAVR